MPKEGHYFCALCVMFSNNAGLFSTSLSIEMKDSFRFPEEILSTLLLFHEVGRFVSRSCQIFVNFIVRITQSVTHAPNSLNQRIAKFMTQL